LKHVGQFEESLLALSNKCGEKNKKKERFSFESDFLLSVEEFNFIFTFRSL